MIIDVYTHIMPKEYVALLLEKTSPDFDYGEIQARKGFEQFVDVDARLKHMDQFKIDMQLLGIPHAVPANDPSLCKVANDSIASIVNRNPDRFLGIAAIPLRGDNVEGALDELRRAARELGLNGVMLPCKLPGLNLDDVRLRPFFDLLVKLDLPIFFMPADSQAFPEIQDYALARIYGWPFSSTLAIATLAFSGVLEDYPQLKVVAHHLGGMIPFYSGRMQNFWANPKYRVFMKRKLNKSVSEYAKMTYADTSMSGFTPALECALAFYGAQHIMFGTDYPMGPNAGTLYLERILKSIDEARISEEDKNNILWNNASKLMKLDR